MVVRRRRKTLKIAVEPDASVVVAAPVDASIEAIADRVRKRAAWVRRQQRYVLVEGELRFNCQGRSSCRAGVAVRSAA